MASEIAFPSPLCKTADFGEAELTCEPNEREISHDVVLVERRKERKIWETKILHLFLFSRTFRCTIERRCSLFFFLFLRICDFPWPLRAFTSLFFSFHYSSSYTDETAERARYALCWMLLEITRRFSKGALFRVNVALSNFSTD